MTKPVEPVPKSTFVQALLVFLLVNAGLSFFNLIPFDLYKFNYKGWAWWTFNDLRTEGTVHNVALLGSSTMVSAIAGCDANFLHRTLDLTKYHRASYLDYRLSTIFEGLFDSFSLAAPGQMPSDAYLALKAMVISSRRPDVVIYGVAPRDFIDSTLSAPCDTEQFKYLSRLVNIEDVVPVIFRSPFNRLDWYLQKIIYIYGYSLDVRIWMTELAEFVLNQILPKPFSKQPFTWWDRVRLLPNYLPAEIHPQAVLAVPVGPKVEKSDASSYKDNTKEYQQRYQSPDPHTYKTQMFFLRKLAQYCHQERIELILVNMPITFYNASMLRPGVYLNYVQALREFALRNNVVFYDLCDFNQYRQSCFHDSVHLNASGGKKFFEQLVSNLVNDKRPAEMLSLSGMQLQRVKAIASSVGRKRVDKM